MDLIEKTIEFAKAKLASFDAGHDWAHTERVLNLARRILKEEQQTSGSMVAERSNEETDAPGSPKNNVSADPEIVELSVILHDIADTKFHKGSEEDGGNMAYDFLVEQGLEHNRADHIRDIINGISFKKHHDSESVKQPGTTKSIEFKIVQDADRLDAMGAIGIARAFTYGGYKNRPLYDPSISPAKFSSSAEYKKSASPTINHFHEKLFLLKDLMNTETGRRLAQERHDYMVDYVERFKKEWEG